MSDAQNDLPVTRAQLATIIAPMSNAMTHMSISLRNMLDGEDEMAEDRLWQVLDAMEAFQRAVAALAEADK